MDMLEGKDYSAVHLELPVIAAFIGWTIGYSDKPKPTTVRSLNSDWVNYSMFKPCIVIISKKFS